MWGEGLNYKLLFLPIVAPALAVALTGSKSLWLWVPLAIWTALWFGFISWRGVRMGLVTTKTADRHYDRVTKFELAHEYHATESALSARKYKRNKHG